MKQLLNSRHTLTTRTSPRLIEPQPAQVLTDTHTPQPLQTVQTSTEEKLNILINEVGNLNKKIEDLQKQGQS
jgi:hypothetical protein